MHTAVEQKHKVATILLFTLCHRGSDPCHAMEGPRILRAGESQGTRCHFGDLSAAPTAEIILTLQKTVKTIGHPQISGQVS